MEFQKYCQTLEQKISNSYTDGISTEQAERLAGEFLSAMLKVSDEIKVQALDARMKKSGLKAIRAAIYLDIIQKADKRPTEAHTSAMIDSDKIVLEEQRRLDEAEVTVDQLERCYSIFSNAHIHYRGIAKGRIE